MIEMSLEPLLNENYTKDKLGPYYMSFHSKANYNGHYDADGIPMLDYYGSIGIQYNPIAIETSLKKMIKEFTK